MEQKILVEYIRKNGYRNMNSETDKWNKGRKKAQRVGVVVAIDKDHIGWAKCHEWLDEYTNERGLEIATGRAMKYNFFSLTFERNDDGTHYIIYQDKQIGRIDSQMINAIGAMRTRAQKYFKDKIKNKAVYVALSESDKASLSELLDSEEIDAWLLEKKFIRTSDGLVTADSINFPPGRKDFKSGWTPGDMG